MLVPPAAGVGFEGTGAGAGAFSDLSTTLGTGPTLKRDTNSKFVNNKNAAVCVHARGEAGNGNGKGGHTTAWAPAPRLHLVGDSS